MINKTQHSTAVKLNFDAKTKIQDMLSVFRDRYDLKINQGDFVSYLLKCDNDDLIELVANSIKKNIIK